MRVASISYVGLLTMMTVLIFLFGPHPVTSQSETDTCLPIVQRILEEVGNRCGDMTRNSACYGNSSISATFVDTASDNVFTEPGDTTEVTRLQKLETAPLSPDFNIWGVSLMKLQASIPNTIPGQGVIFVLYGDVSLENAVPDNNNFSPIDEPISVITRSGANIRSGPSTNNNVLASVPSGAELAADAVNPDRTWLRVVTEGQIGWVSTQVLRSNDKMSTLPVLTRESRMPMQSFYLSASVAGVTCAEAPALLVVQGPEGVIVDITANGVDIRMGSTIVIRMLDSHTMEVIAIHGTVRIGNLLIPPGFAITVPLTEDGHNQDGPLLNLRPLDELGLAELQSVESIAPNLLNYPIKLPTIEDIVSSMTAVGGGSVRAIATGPAAGRAQCSTMRLTSPLEGWKRTATTFYWDGAVGATSYRLIIDGVGSSETTATNAIFALGLAGDVPSISWRVEALVGGQLACLAGPITIPRDQFDSGGSGGSGCYYDMTTHTEVCN